MRKLLFLLFLSATISCAQKKHSIKGDTEWQQKMNADFKDASKSPLKKKDLRKFEGLDFFDHDSTFIVNAQLTSTPNSEFFKMRTTTDRMSEERVYGVVMFKMKGKEYKLNIYQGKENMETKGLEDYLFLPFLDDTNGESTYGGGRYIDLRIPISDSITIDFNKAYNPYCAYNEKYSCPIVPRENYLAIEVKAGVKVFKKH